MPAPLSTAGHFTFGDYRLDVRNHELLGADGAPVALTRKAFDVLLHLIVHRDRLVRKDELLVAVWPGRVVEENNLTQAVSALRHALGTGAGDDRYIRTVPGLGYRFILEVREDDADPVAISAATIASDVETMAGFPVWRRWALLGVAVPVLVLVAVAAWRGREVASRASAQPQPSQATLAVLPFRSLSPGRQDQLLELGLAETLITRLSHSRSLRVRSLASAQRLAGPQQEPLAAARMLGASYIVEGSTQRIGERVRVNARLLSAPDGAAVWTGTFDERVDQLFTLQDRIANAVAATLSLQLDPLPARNRSPCDGPNQEAHHAYLLGRYQYNRPDPQRLEQGLAAFRRAIELDPACARAYAGLAYTYRTLGLMDREPSTILPPARAAIEQALRLDPESAEAHSVQGWLRFWYEWDWTGAEASFQRALALNPSLPEAHFGYAHLLINLGRFDEGLQQMQQARELDPLSPLLAALHASFLGAANRPEEARRQAERALELEPDFWLGLANRGMVAARDDHAAAIADLRRAAERSRGNSRPIAFLAVSYAEAGDRGRARTILRDLQAQAARGYVPPTSLAYVHNALGDTDSALAELERAYAAHDPRITLIKIDARWNNLRAQPRFQALAKHLGLEAANHAYGRW